MRRILITGGAGFIGSNFVKFWHSKHHADHLFVLDALTYAGNFENIRNVVDDQVVRFFQGDIGDKSLVQNILTENEIDTVINFAAESHVDRSIEKPNKFIETNVVGTHNLLACAVKAWKGNFEKKKFHHVSTDEVYGDLTPLEAKFVETTSYAPNSPYAASKASSDHLVRAYGITYGIPFTISNCSNNYGPYHYPEKLIPLVITRILDGKSIPIYGDGKNIRDWIFVEDHCRAIEAIIRHSKSGETYNIGGNNELTNLDLVHIICDCIVKELHSQPSKLKHFINSPTAIGMSPKNLIHFVKDRPGHDRRYAVDSSKIEKDLGFVPNIKFEDGLSRTIKWYLCNEKWWRPLLKE